MSHQQGREQSSFKPKIMDSALQRGHWKGVARPNLGMGMYKEYVLSLKFTLETDQKPLVELLFNCLVQDAPWNIVLPSSTDSIQPRSLRRSL